MPRLSSSFTLVAAFMLAACGGSSEPVKTADDAAAKPADKPREAATTGAPAEAANKPVENAQDTKKKPDEQQSGPAKPVDFKGEDPGVAVKLTGPKAWTLGEGDSWRIGLYDFIRTEGTRNYFRVFGDQGEFWVPGAFTVDAKAPQGLKKGDPVLLTIATQAVCARVMSTSDKKVKVMYDWADKVDTHEVEPEELLALDGKLSFGAPVLYKEEADHEDWQTGTLVYMDKKTAWLAGEIKTDPKLVKPVDVTKKYKKGDKVLAYPKNVYSVYRSGKITKVLEDGLYYEYQTDEGDTETAHYCNVTSPVK